MDVNAGEWEGAGDGELGFGGMVTVRDGKRARAGIALRWRRVSSGRP